MFECSRYIAPFKTDADYSPIYPTRARKCSSENTLQLGLIPLPHRRDRISRHELFVPKAICNGKVSDGIYVRPRIG